MSECYIGLKNAPFIFQLLLNNMVDNMACFAAAYVDGIVIFTKTLVEHMVHLESVFKTRREGTGTQAYEM